MFVENIKLCEKLIYFINFDKILTKNIIFVLKSKK